MEAKRILAILDPELGETRAAGRAAALARSTGASLTLAVFEDRQTIVQSGVLGEALTEEAIEAYRKQAAEWLEQVAGDLDTGNKPAETRVIFGRPLHEKICETVANDGFDFVVKDSRAGSRLRRALFTPLDWHLLRRCPVPLMLVKSDSPALPRRIAAAVDPFHERGKPAALDVQLLETARDLADTFTGEWHAIHACQTHPLGTGSPLEGPSLNFDEVREKISKHHSDALHRMTDEVGLPRERAHFLDGPVNRAIVDFTRDREIDLLVMGTVTRKGLTRILMGSTAEAIIDNVEADVLAIKPEGFTQALEALAP